MYKVTNLKKTPRPLPIPGRPVILPKQGSSCEVREREVSDLLRSMAKEGYIRIEDLETEDPPEDENCPGYKQFKRISALRAAKERAARRASGDLN